MAQTTDPRQFIFINHPNVIFPAVATVLAFPALSPTPSFFPLTILVATLLVYSRIVVPRRHAPRTIFGAFFGVSFASTLSHLMPSIHALASFPSSIALLWMISSMASSVAFAIVILSDRLSLRLENPWAKVMLFPAFWATAWQFISHMSPVGHLVTWSPVTGIASYEWMRQLFGTWGINWLVGAWAIVIAEIAGAWFIGPVDDFEPHGHGPLIPSIASNGDSQPLSERPTTFPGPRHTLFLGTALLILTIPSIISPTIPALPWSTSSTPLPVGCVLPHPSSADDADTPLDRFIAESKQHNGARILLWPEGALKFETISQREEALKRVQEEIKGPFVGVTFTEPVPSDAGWSHAREGSWRNGLVLVGPKGPVAEFYKRNLVPIAESFSLTESRDDPEIYELELRGTNNNKKWTPIPPHVRPLPVTAAICLDFSSPGVFSSLDSRPALILAPAQTWHHDVSMAMWEQARARAEEAGSMVLFCDGGAQGASGIAGHGIQEPVQFGSGSWTRTIGISYPFYERRTLYMWGGETLQFGFVWLLLGAGWATEVFILRSSHGDAHARGRMLPFSRLRELLHRARAAIRRPAPLTQGERQPLLL